MPWHHAALAAAAIALGAHLARALTRDGAVAAWAVGTAVLLGTGWAGGGVLLAFFLPTTLVGRLVSRSTASDAKGEQRDAAQVLANGGAGALGALVGLHDPALGRWLLAAPLAAAAADTWATAWGSRSAAPPRSILTGRVVPPGTSGGISVTGTAGAAAGAAVVATAWALADGPRPVVGPPLSAWLLAIGLGGMLADSALGAALQGRFRCPACDAPSERRVHRCGTATVPVGGLPWLGNDLVNALATALALGIAWLLR